MNTSAELSIVEMAYDDPVVQELVHQVQAEYVVRYGGPDATPVEPAQFAPPNGAFLVALADGEPVGCGGWRSHDAHTAEFKRMFVVASARRRGYAVRLLSALEDSARRAGMTSAVLETGSAQPEAVAMYERQGYHRIAPFGYYADAPLSIPFGIAL